MILIISTCRERLSELEFVRPIEKMIKDCFTKNYKDLAQKDIEVAEKIIITGTALKDFDYLEHDFEWLLNCGKPILGICAGMQIIAKEFEIPLVTFVTIGARPVEIVADNELAKGTFNAYFLHTKTGFEGFKTLALTNGKPCMIKHPDKEIYGCIFHPEVMNEDIINRFVHTQG